MWTDFIQTITDLFKRIDNDNIELREKISQILYRIHLLISKVSDDIENGESITYSSSLMLTLTDEIYESVKNLIRVGEMEKTYKLFKSCSQIDIELDDIDIRKVTVLREISEEIKVLSFCLIDNKCEMTMFETNEKL